MATINALAHQGWIAGHQNGAGGVVDKITIAVYTLGRHAGLRFIHWADT